MTRGYVRVSITNGERIQMKTKVTTSEIVNIIQRTVKGTMAVSVDAVTEPDMRKTGNPYHGKVMKHCTMNGLIGFDYENAINNQDKREGGAGEREAKPRKWGVLTPDRLFVTHKDSYYLQMKVQSASDPVYFMDGKEISVDILKPFMPVKKISSSQEGLEKEVIVRDVKLENVKSIRFNGADYEILPVPMAMPVPVEQEAVLVD
jgi:hypothetical protein